MADLAYPTILIPHCIIEICLRPLHLPAVVGPPMSLQSKLNYNFYAKVYPFRAKIITLIVQSPLPNSIIFSTDTSSTLPSVKSVCMCYYHLVNIFTVQYAQLLVRPGAVRRPRCRRRHLGKHWLPPNIITTTNVNALAELKLIQLGSNNLPPRSTYLSPSANLFSGPGTVAVPSKELYLSRVLLSLHTYKLQPTDNHHPPTTLYFMFR